jgi:hypothetical protein
MKRLTPNLSLSSSSPPPLLLPSCSSTMRVTLQLLVVSALLRQATAFLSLVNSGVTFQRHGQVKNALASFSDGYDESYLQTPAVTTRKSFVEDVIRASFGLSFVAMTPSSALASGGATAGGACECI